MPLTNTEVMVTLAMVPASASPDMTIATTLSAFVPPCRFRSPLPPSSAMCLAICTSCASLSSMLLLPIEG